MSEKTNREKMLDEEEYFPDQELADLAYECSEGLLLINSQPPRSLERQMFLQKFFGSIGNHVTIKGNFNCDYGKNIYIGSGTILNCNSDGCDHWRKCGCCSRSGGHKRCAG